MQANDILEHIGSVINFLKCLVKSKYSTIKTAKNNPNLYLLANGPSLKDVLSDQNEFKGDVLVVNSFHTSEYFKKIKPKHYVISAPEFWLPMEAEFYVNMQSELEKSFKNDVDWNMIFYIPVKSKKHKYKAKIEALNSKITVQYYNDTALDSYGTLDKVILSQKLGMPRPHNVLIPSLMIGIWSGYKTINLYGADHSWLPLIKVLDNNVAVLSHNHFYDKDRQEHKPMTKKGIGQRNLHEMLQKFYLTFKGYHVIEKLARRKNIRIINCTKNSFIDAFERNQQNG